MKIETLEGLGNGRRIFVCGYLLRGNPTSHFRPSRSLLTHNFRLMRMYLEKASKSRGEIFWRFHYGSGSVNTASDGYFEVDITLETDLPPGKHTISLSHQSDFQQFTKAEIHVAEPGLWLIISDIDDTVLVSHSGKVRKRLTEILLKPAFRRKLFHETAELFQILAGLGHVAGKQNPVLYVSASEWNLASYLKTLFQILDMPEGYFSLHPRRHWTQWMQSGKWPGEKEERIRQWLRFFPERKALLFGDNSQADPEIYVKICQDFPEKIGMVALRLVKKKRKEQTENIIQQIKDLGIHCLAFDHSTEVKKYLEENKLESGLFP